MSREYGKHTQAGHNTAQIPSANIQRSTFDRSHGHKTTMLAAGRLVPMFIDEILPGDTMNCRAHIFARQATPKWPVMDNMTLTSFTFFTPMRLVWDNFEKFMGAQEDPDSSTDFTIPQVDMTADPESNRVHLNHDYMGIPPDAGTKTVNALPGRCIQLIWNTWFRAQDLQDSKTVQMDDGPDTIGDQSSVRFRGKRHDYFTSALPFTEKKPDHLNAPLILTGQYPVIRSGDMEPEWRGGGGSTIRYLKYNTSDQLTTWDSQPTTNDPAIWGEDVKLQVDFDSQGGGTTNTINELRLAFQMQKLFERDARGGTRLQEVILAHFGVKGSDARLNRPEFLGGGKQNISTTAVPSTNQSANVELGELGAVATSSGSNHSWSKSFTEHGYVITFVCVDADLTYQRGVERLWTRKTKHDFYWPALAGIGEQRIRNDEIHATGVGDEALMTGDAGTFGYTPRYEEYRTKVSRTSGFMRSSNATPLDTWHLAQDFGDSLPVLGDTFIRSVPPVARISQITTEGHFIIDIAFDYKCTRPMPTWGIPGMLDRF